MTKICVIIPAYNESKAIGGVIKAAKRYIDDVLVIDDGSRDNTPSIAKESGAFVLSFPKNKGKGEALKDGFRYAVVNNYDAVITMDADGQHLPSDLPKFINAARPTCVGIVAGNRMTDPHRMPLVRIATNFLMSSIISFFCRQRVPDTQCGFRLIKCDLLKKSRLISSKYEIESELLIKACRLGFKIESVPIKSVYTGQVSLINPVVDTWRFLVMLFRMMI